MTTDARHSWMGPLQLTKPSRELLETTVQAASTASFDYEPVGRTDTELPEGWDLDVQRIELGAGAELWSRAVRALTTWAQFDLTWVHPYDRTVPLKVGATFAFVSRQLGLWSVNVCRLVYVIDEQTMGTARFGFAYGTIGTHLVKGEERFLLERDKHGTVWFEIRKFSRPAHLAVRATGPLARSYQRRFSADALARLAREVGK